jgi:hypothetical protein
VLELLLWLTARDGVRVAPARLAERIEQGCTAGEPVACALRGIELSDRRAVAQAMQPLCEQGQVTACLGQAWASMPLAGSSVDPLRAPDPEQIRALVLKACRAGELRACTEFGSVHALGVGTYAGPLAAEERWAEACDAGEPRACSLLGHQLRDRGYVQEGLSGGDVAAWVLLAELSPRELPEALKSACEGGVTGACVTLAEELLQANLTSADILPGSEYEVPRQAFGQACELGDPVACAWILRIDAATGVLGRPQAIEGLSALCSAVSWACEQAHFLREAPESPVHLIYPGDVGADSHFTRLVFDHRAEFDKCDRAWVAVEPEAAGTVDLVLQVEASGVVSSAYAARAAGSSEAARAHAECAAKVAQGKTLHPPVGGPARMVVELPVYHGADVKFAPLFPSPGGDVEAGQLGLDRPAWALAADRCLIQSVGPVPGVEMLLGFQALRSGLVRSVSVLESSEEEGLDECMVDWLSQHQFIAPVHVPLAVSARVRFLRTLTEPPLTAPRPRPPPPPSRVPPTPVRVLVLRVSTALIGSRPARFARSTRSSIALAHEQLEQEVLRLTHGGLVLQTTVRDLQARTSAVQPTSDGTWLLSPDGLERAILDEIEPGQWDSVFVWVPTLGYGQPSEAVTLETTTVRGATLSVLPVPGSGELRVQQGLPPWELPLRALWRQVSARADRLLGVQLPSDSEPLVVDHYLLDPRLGRSPPSHTVLGWYTEVMGYRVHPELWRDLWRTGRYTRGNLAQQAMAVGEGVVNPEGLNDTVIELGRFSNVPVGDPDAEAISFGLQWRTPVRIQQVVAHVGDRAAPGSPSLKTPALEVLGPDLQEWVAVQAQVTTEGAEIRFVMAPMDVYGVRLRVTDGAVSPACRELEVY